MSSMDSAGRPLACAGDSTSSPVHPESFVRTVVRERWEREPALCRGVISPPTTPERLFSSLRAVSVALATRAALPIGVGARIYRGTVALESDEDGVLPGAEDLDFDAYRGRVSLGREADRGVVVRGCPHFDERIHESVARVTRGVAEELGGLPGGLVEVSLFAGSYSRTPFGIHQDDLGVFLMPIVGTKEVRVWPKEVPIEQIQAMRRQRPEALDAPWVFEVTPSDVLYFPRGFWHVTRSLTGYSASVSVGFGPEREDLLLRSLSPEVSRAVALPVEFAAQRHGVAPLELCTLDPSDWVGSARRLPPPAERIRGFAAGLSSDVRSRLDRDLTRWWLRRVSLSGGSVSPPLSASRWDGSDTLEVRSPVVWLEEGDAMVVAARGRLFEVPRLPQLVRLFRRLGEGHVFSVRRLIRTYARRVVTVEGEFVATRKGVEGVIRKLVDLGALGAVA